MAGTLVIDTLTDGSGNSTAATNAIRGSAKAWVNWNGASPVTIRASYNVSSITRNAVGDYTVNFTNAFADANYVSIGMQSVGAGSGQPQGMFGLLNTSTPTTTSSGRFTALTNLFSTTDPLYCSAAFFR